MGCFKIVIDKLKKDVQKKMGNLSAVKVSHEKFERLSERSSDKVSRDFKMPTWIEEANNPRVAMDFSYGTGRVVNDPIEAAEIARREARGSSSQRTTRFQSLIPAPLESLRFGPHLTQGYYHGNLSREQAEEMIIRNGTNGAFILRDSKNRPGCLVLTYVHALRAHHQYVSPVILHDKEQGENILLATCDKETVFYDVHSLIEFHRLNKGSLQCTLAVAIKNPEQPDGTPPRHRKPRSSAHSPKSRTSSPQVGRFQDRTASPQQPSDSANERHILSPLQVSLDDAAALVTEEPPTQLSSIKITPPLVDLFTSLESIPQPSPTHPDRSPTQHNTSPSVSSRDEASRKPSRSNSPRV